MFRPTITSISSHSQASCQPRSFDCAQLQNWRDTADLQAQRYPIKKGKTTWLGILFPLPSNSRSGDGYSNVKTDRGGSTKHGVTHTALAAHRGVKSVTAEQVRAMSGRRPPTSTGALTGRSVAAINCCPGSGYAVFDFGVNSGRLAPSRRCRRSSVPARTVTSASRPLRPFANTPAEPARSSAITAKPHALLRVPA